MENFPIADSLAGTGKAQRLDGNIQPELVSILETINYRARDAVNANGNTIDGVRFDSLIEGRSIKAIDPHRGRAQAQSRVSTARNGEICDSRNLRRDAMEGQRRYQAHDRLRCFGRHHCEVRIAELLSGGESIKSACESHKLTVLDETVERGGMNAPHQGLTRSHHAPVPTEGFEGGLDIASLSHIG